MWGTSGRIDFGSKSKLFLIWLIQQMLLGFVRIGSSWPEGGFIVVGGGGLLLFQVSVAGEPGEVAF